MVVVRLGLDTKATWLSSGNDHSLVKIQENGKVRKEIEKSRRCPVKTSPKCKLFMSPEEQPCRNAFFHMIPRLRQCFVYLERIGLPQKFKNTKFGDLVFTGQRQSVH